MRILERLADDLLVLATLDQQNADLPRHRIRLDELLLDCISRLTQLSRDRDVSWDIQTEDPVEIDCDSMSLDRAITNVLANAIKYSHQSGSIRVGLAGDARAATIVVADEGIGIPETDLPRIFDRFYRGDYARNTQGTGLGLAIVKGIVDSHNGSVDIVSTFGAGTTVTITLPAGESGEGT